jgi:hypothetical protein
VLFDVSPVDPLTYAAVLVMYSAAALAAAIVPARQRCAWIPSSRFARSRAWT